MSAQKNKPARPAAINIHIETLVVDGLAVRNANHLGLAIQNELQTLLADQGLALLGCESKSGAHLKIAALRTPAIHTSRTPHAADAGGKIARAIQRGLAS